MTVSRRRVWRAAPRTLTLAWLFTVAAAAAVLPALAYLTYVRQGAVWLPALLGLLTCASVLYGWRYGTHPSLRASDEGVVVTNPWRTIRLSWPDISLVAPGPDGLVVGSEETQAEAWCVQKSGQAIRTARRTRADQITDELLDLLDAYAPLPANQAAGLRFRRARPGQSRLLTDLERAASEAALSHIFAQVAYPSADVTRRWARLLQDRRSCVRILELVDRPVGFVAFDQHSVLHLGVVPEQHATGFRLGPARARHAGDLRRRIVRGAPVGAHRQLRRAQPLQRARLAADRTIAPLRVPALSSGGRAEPQQPGSASARARPPARQLTGSATNV